MRLNQRKRNFTRIISLLLAVAMIIMLAPGLNAEAAKKKKGWVSKGGYKYYYSKTGKMAKGFTKVGKSTYYFAPKKMTVKYNVPAKAVVTKTAVPKGAALKGWYKIKKDYYYFNRSSGKMAKSTVVDGIKIKKNGKAKKNAYNIKKIETMILARERVQYLTNVKDSKNEKKLKCFNYVKDSFIRNSTYDGGNIIVLENMRSRKDWDCLFAGIGLTNEIGDCVAWAASYAYLLHECGFSKVYIVDDKKGEGYNINNPAHAWVVANDKVYDTYFASYKGVDGNYDTGYKFNGTGTYEDWPVNMKEISSGESSQYQY